MIYSILTATKDALITGLILDATRVTIELDAQPPISCGDEHVCVHALGWRNHSHELVESIAEEYDIGVTITRRVGHIPVDRFHDQSFLKLTSGLEQRIRQCIIVLHYSYTIITSANALIGAHPSGGNHRHIEPLVWMDCDPFPIPRGPEWFYSSDAPSQAPSGLSMTARFRGAARYQTMSQFT